MGVQLDHVSKEQATILKRCLLLYEEEEQRLLQEIGLILSRKTFTISRSSCSSDQEALSPSLSCQLKASVDDGQPCSGGSAILSTMCHLMHLIVHLRRQNRHLKRQVNCLDEMREVQCLQSEILQKACACVNASRSNYIFNASIREERDKEEENNSIEAERKDAPAQLFQDKLVELTLSPSSISPVVVVAASAAGRLCRLGIDERNELLPGGEAGDEEVEEEKEEEEAGDEDKLGAQKAFANSSMANVGGRKTSDEPIFTEVQLPSYARKKATAPQGDARHSCVSSVSSAQCYTPVSLPDTGSSSRVSRLFEKLGIKKGTLKRPTLSSSLAAVGGGETKRHTVGPVGDVRLLGARKASVKKRKRKISDSDSWASSEAAGKIYSLLECTEKFNTSALAKYEPAGQMASNSSMGKKQPTYKHQHGQCTVATVNDVAQRFRRTSSSSSEAESQVLIRQQCSNALPEYRHSVDALKTNEPLAGAYSAESPSRMTISNDSVFTAQEDVANNAYASGVTILKQLLAMQEKNCMLIDQLKEKTNEYDDIVKRIGGLEESMRALRNRLKLNNFFQAVHREKGVDNSGLPTPSLVDIEKHFKTLEHRIKETKADCYKIQQTSSEAQNKQLLVDRRYLDKVDSLHAANVQLARQVQSRPDKAGPSYQLDNLQSRHQALYKFTVKLMDRMHQMRKALIEADCVCTNRGAELLQMQSSLLLAHFQIERQKVELNRAKTNRLRRTQTYSGQSLLSKQIDTELSFYLPFKLHGRQMKCERGSWDALLRIPDDILEAEFLALINPSQCTTVAPIMEDQKKYVNRVSGLPRRVEENRPSPSKNCGAWMESRNVQDLRRRRPQHVVDSGRVRQLASAFDMNRLETKYSSTSALPHYGYRTFYNAPPNQQTARGRNKWYESIGTMERSDGARSSEQYDSSLTDSYRETEYETMVNQLAIRPVPISVVPPQRFERVALPSRSIGNALQGQSSAKKITPQQYASNVSKVRPLYCPVRPSAIPQPTPYATEVGQHQCYDSSATDRRSWFQKFRRKT